MDRRSFLQTLGSILPLPFLMSKLPESDVSSWETDSHGLTLSGKAFLGADWENEITIDGVTYRAETLEYTGSCDPIFDFETSIGSGYASYHPGLVKRSLRVKNLDRSVVFNIGERYLIETAFLEPTSMYLISSWGFALPSHPFTLQSFVFSETKEI